MGLSSASRSVSVSWSASKLSATAQRVPSGQVFGRRLRPARARPTILRHVISGHCQGSMLMSGVSSLRQQAHAAPGSPCGKRASMADNDPALLNAEDMLAAYARGQLSPVEVLQAVTERVARLNPSLNAFAVLNPDALHAAGESASRWRSGRPIGPLDGVPCTVKDLVDLAGFPTRRGSRTTSADPV